jgi:hypothetical protein
LGGQNERPLLFFLSDFNQGDCMKSVHSLLLLILSSATVAGWAQEPESPDPPVPPVKESAGGLLKACAASSLTPRGRLRLRYCYGYLTGVEETMRVLMKTQDVLCPPPAITTRELARVYVSYASVRSDSLHLPAVTMVARALRDRFPCRP